MNELRKKVIEEFDAMIQDMVEEVDRASREGDGLDMGNLFGKQSQHYRSLSLAFDDFESRLNKVYKKRGLF